jgi:hypothetical protein
VRVVVQVFQKEGIQKEVTVDVTLFGKMSAQDQYQELSSDRRVSRQRRACSGAPRQSLLVPSRSPRRCVLHGHPRARSADSPARPAQRKFSINCPVKRTLCDKITLLRVPSIEWNQYRADISMKGGAMSCAAPRRAAAAG